MMSFTEVLLELAALPCLLLVDMGYREVVQVLVQWYRTTVHGELPTEEYETGALTKISRE